MEIGKICIDYPDAVADLQSVLTKDNCKQGMLNYLESYNGGIIPILSKTIGDGGQYINHLAYKFSSDAANWVWNRDTVHSKIDELITEYEIIDCSNRVLAKNTTFQETIRAWCNKVSQIRLAYSIIKNNLCEGKEFYEALRDLKKANSLLDSQKKRFLELLKANVEEFKQFMATQSKLFEKSCGFYLDDLTSEDVKNILEDDQYGFKGTYLSEPDSYTEKVQEAVKKYKSSLGHIKLRKLWKEKTGTESPFDWALTYTMPILAMVPETEIATARKVFGTINAKSTDNDAIETAMAYVTKLSYVTDLNSQVARDKAFTEAFLGEYAVLFDDVDGVKKYLKGHVTEHPYHWLGSKEVDRKVKAMAQAKYTDSGYGKAKKIIDDMPADQVKAYLKQLIEDNIVVGVEIIKGKK